MKNHSKQSKAILLGFLAIAFVYISQEVRGSKQTSDILTISEIPMDMPSASSSPMISPITSTASSSTYEWMTPPASSSSAAASIDMTPQASSSSAATSINMTPPSSSANSVPSSPPTNVTPSSSSKSSAAIANNCHDFMDNDGDGKKDMQDEDCQQGRLEGSPAPVPQCAQKPGCNDHVDNDINGLIDCADIERCVTGTGESFTVPTSRTPLMSSRASSSKSSIRNKMLHFAAPLPTLKKRSMFNREQESEATITAPTLKPPSLTETPKTKSLPSVFAKQRFRRSWLLKLDQ